MYCFTSLSFYPLKCSKHINIKKLFENLCLYLTPPPKKISIQCTMKIASYHDFCVILLALPSSHNRFLTVQLLLLLMLLLK